MHQNVISKKEHIVIVKKSLVSGKGCTKMRLVKKVLTKMRTGNWNDRVFNLCIIN